MGNFIRSRWFFVLYTVFSLGVDFMLNLAVPTSGTWLFLAFAFIQIFALMQENNSLKNTRPNVVVENKVDSEVLTLNIIGKVDGETVSLGTGDTIERFYVGFKNIKTMSVKTENALGAYARVSFYKLDCTPIYSNDKVRWWKRYDPLDPDTWEEEVNIEASGKPEQLFLILRKKNTKTLYIFNQSSYKGESWIIPKLKLKVDEFMINIHLSANNMDAQEYWIRVKNLGKSKTPVFTKMDIHPCEDTND